jgi:hypothetical protein
MNVTSERLGQSARNNARRSSSVRKVGIDLIVASGFEGGGHRGSILRSPPDSVVGGRVRSDECRRLGQSAMPNAL